MIHLRRIDLFEDFFCKFLGHPLIGIADVDPRVAVFNIVQGEVPLHPFRVKRPGYNPHVVKT